MSHTTNNKKIVDKICKCLRLSESSNPNEAALALRQAASLMKKYGVTDAQVLAAEVSECATQIVEQYSPPFWALALANLVADAFECRYLISRCYGRRPEFRFIGLGFRAEVATYSYTVLHRYLHKAIEEFELTVKEQHTKTMGKKDLECQRRTEVFTQAWLFRAGRSIAEFSSGVAEKKIVDDYIKEKYGETVELGATEQANTQSANYDDILDGMRAADDVELYRSVKGFIKPLLLQHKHSS